MTQQTTRYLLKTFRSVQAGKVSEKHANFSARYMIEYISNPNARCSVTTSSELKNPEVLLSAFKHRVASMVEKVVRAIDVEQKTWNDMLVEVYRISRAHCQLMLASNFISAVFGNAANSTTAVLQRVAILFCVSTMEQELADFLTSGYLSAEQALLVKEANIAALKDIRPEAVALVDAFGLPDYLMQSALGDQDGRAYERMTEMAELEPLNQTRVADGYQEYIKPLVHAGKSRWNVGSDGIARL